MNEAGGGSEDEFSLNGLRRIGLRLELNRATNNHLLTVARYWNTPASHIEVSLPFAKWFTLRATKTYP